MTLSTQLFRQVVACSLICFAIVAMCCIAIVIVRALISDARHRRLRTGLLPMRLAPQSTPTQTREKTPAAA